MLRLLEQLQGEGLARAGFKAVFPEGSWDTAGEGAEAARAFCETMSASVAVESLSARGFPLLVLTFLLFLAHF